MRRPSYGQICFMSKLFHCVSFQYHSKNKAFWLYEEVLSFIYTRYIHRKKNSLCRQSWRKRILYPRVLHQRPGRLSVLCFVLAVLSAVFFWAEVSDVVPGICWHHWHSLGVTAPCSPVTTDAFTPLCFCPPHLAGHHSGNPGKHPGFLPFQLGSDAQ